MEKRKGCSLKQGSGGIGRGLSCRAGILHAFRHPYDEETMEYDDGGGGGGGGAPADGADGAGTTGAAGGSNAD